MLFSEIIINKVLFGKKLSYTVLYSGAFLNIVTYNYL